METPKTQGGCHRRNVKGNTKSDKYFKAMEMVNQKSEYSSCGSEK